MEYLHHHLYDLATQASQFSNQVHAQLARCAQGEAKISALENASINNAENLNILAHIVQARESRRAEHDHNIEHWATTKNAEVKRLAEHTTLTKGQVRQLQQELAYERDTRTKEQTGQDKGIKSLEDKVRDFSEQIQAIKKSRGGDSPKPSTTAGIRKGIKDLTIPENPSATVRPRRQRPQRPTAQDLFQTADAPRTPYAQSIASSQSPTPPDKRHPRIDDPVRNAQLIEELLIQDKAML